MWQGGVGFCSGIKRIYFIAHLEFVELMPCVSEKIALSSAPLIYLHLLLIQR